MLRSCSLMAGKVLTTTDGSIQGQILTNSSND